MSFNQISSPLLRTVSSFLDDRDLATVSTISKWTRTSTSQLWEQRYKQKRVTDVFFVEVPGDTNFRRAYSQAFKLKHSITNFVDTRSLRCTITQATNVRTSLEGRFTVTRLNAEIFGTFFMHNSEMFVTCFIHRLLKFNSTRQDCPSDSHQKTSHCYWGGARTQVQMVFIKDSKNPHLSALAISEDPSDGSVTNTSEDESKIKGIYNRIYREDLISAGCRFIKGNIAHVAVALMGVATKFFLENPRL